MKLILSAKASGADASIPVMALLSEIPILLDGLPAVKCHYLIGPRAETIAALWVTKGQAAPAVAMEKPGVRSRAATMYSATTWELVRKQAAEVGYPLMLKASGGGGGSAGCRSASTKKTDLKKKF